MPHTPPLTLGASVLVTDETTTPPAFHEGVLVGLYGSVPFKPGLWTVDVEGLGPQPYEPRHVEAVTEQVAA